MYLRLNPKASEEDWNVRWQQCANSENMHSDKQALMKELVGKCWPEMAHILPEYLGGFKDAQLLNILNGLLVPEPERFLEVLDIKESQTAQVCLPSRRVGSCVYDMNNLHPSHPPPPLPPLCILDQRSAYGRSTGLNSLPPRHSFWLSANAK